MVVDILHTPIYHAHSHRTDLKGIRKEATKHDVTKARFPISSKGSDAAVRLSVIPLSRIFHVVPRLDLGAFSLTVSRFMDGLLELSAHLLASL